MKFLRNNILILVMAISLLGCQVKVKQKQTEEKSFEAWIQLFNGKDLNNWDIKFKGEELGVNYNNTFRVEDGLLRVSYDNWEEWNGKFGHMFYDRMFSHYKLRVEYRFVGEQVANGPGWAYRNNGLMLHGQSAQSMELNQDFPTSIEVQLLGGNGTDDRPTMNVCTPGTNIVMDGVLTEQHCMSSDSKTFHGDQWVTVEVEVHGGEVVRHFVNGEEVLSYTEPQYDPRDEYAKKLIPEDGNLIISKGTISIQAESSPTDFRKIELLVLEE
ncbi:3-keto-disaccharide hydrolase [Maribellus sediminis]|uniref:3-keto-disaccharide hydrolase n=1 Tax=Maribellus sediminis TaxID=2696285 RepID=UPI0014308584|nr:DUF1080 domain-containing protein [Maribellus sediminis]